MARGPILYRHDITHKGYEMPKALTKLGRSVPRIFHVHDSLWERVREAATVRGVSMSEVVRRALTSYLARIEPK